MENSSGVTEAYLWLLVIAGAFPHWFKDYHLLEIKCLPASGG